MFSASRTLLVSLAMLAALLAALAGCGSGSEGTASDPAGSTGSSADSESPEATPEPSEVTSPSPTLSVPATDAPTEAILLPTCESVWVEGAKLPGHYQGCLEGSKTVQAEGLYCEFGKPLFAYAKHYYAVENGPVNRTQQALAKDKVFKSAQRKCGG